MENSNTLGKLNNALFDELDALRAVDVTDTEALEREVSRAKAVQGIASDIISNARTIIDSTRLRAELISGKDTPMPRMLTE